MAKHRIEFRRPMETRDLLEALNQHLSLDRIIALEGLDFCRNVHYDDGMTAIHDENNVEIGEIPTPLVWEAGLYCIRRQRLTPKVKGTAGLIFLNDDGTRMTAHDAERAMNLDYA